MDNPWEEMDEELGEQFELQDEQTLLNAPGRLNRLKREKTKYVDGNTIGPYS